MHDYNETFSNLDSQRRIFIREFVNAKLPRTSFSRSYQITPQDAKELLLSYPEVINTISEKEQSFLNAIYDYQLEPTFKELKKHAKSTLHSL
jgi:hypothetical protein